MKPYIFALLLLCVLYVEGSSNQYIKNVDVPKMILLNGEEDQFKRIILDCEYDNIQEQEKSLVIKWLKDDEVIYQWIRGTMPSIMPNYRDKIDATFTISSEPDHKYRGLAILNPTIDTTGTYKCLLETPTITESMEKSLQVIDVSNHTLNLHFTKSSNETHLECTVDNVYPKPIINFETDDEDDITVIKSNVHECDNGFFNGTSIAVVHDNDEDVDTFRCIITFRTFEKYPVNITTMTTSASINCGISFYSLGVYLILYYLFINILTL